jgi:hypothetical protein
MAAPGEKFHHKATKGAKNTKQIAFFDLQKRFRIAFVSFVTLW